MLARITALPRDDRWDALARGALRIDLYAALESLTIAVLESTERAGAAASHHRVGEGQRRRAGPGPRHAREVAKLDSSGIAALSVALRSLRGARSAAAPQLILAGRPGVRAAHPGGDAASRRAG